MCRYKGADRTSVASAASPTTRRDVLGGPEANRSFMNATKSSAVFGITDQPEEIML
jgi:hypothetical protein